MKRMLALIGSLVLLTTFTFGQSAETVPSFEAADVHVSPKIFGQEAQGGFVRSGRYQFKNATMLDLVASAYGVEPDKVVGGPSWLEFDRYDIFAKASASTTNDQAKMMLRSLLADRFKLVLHNEDKPASVYALTALPKRGPQLREAAGGAANCQGVPQNPAPGTVPYQVVACKGMTMEAFAGVVRQMANAYIDNPVVDMTGLQGQWDFEIKWSGRGTLAAAGKDGITIFDALEKQLGLKLELQKRPVASIVVDKVNRKPTDNAPGVEKLLPVVSNEFEVSDIKPSAPDAGTDERANLQPSGRIDLHNVTMKHLIMFAWYGDLTSAMEDLVVVPRWMESARFDVVAKAPSDVSVGRDGAVDADTLIVMLRNLVIDRFKLKFHNEDQPISVYALTSPKREPKMKQADPSARTTCKRTVGSSPQGALLATLTCQNTTMGQLVDRLPSIAGGYVTHPAVDLTGIEDGWDFVLNWTPRRAFQNGGGGEGGQGPSQNPVASDPNGALTLFEGIERLGLKLQVEKRPYPVLVIDHAEQKPTEN
jgi:uncharacterized protein (TIGR03435 family)